MKLKNILSLLLAFVMLFTVQIPICAVDSSATLTAGDREISEKYGNELEISIDATEAILGGSFNLVYDSSVLEYTGVLSGIYNCQVNQDYAANKLRISFAGTHGISSGVMMKFCFRLLVNDSCTTSFSFEDVNLYNAEGKSVETTAVGSVCEAKVLKGFSSVELSNAAPVLGVGEQLQMSIRPTPSDASIERVTWISGYDYVASIDENGLITANHAGSVYMECLVEDSFYRSEWLGFTVTVYEKPNVTVSGGNLAVGESITVTVRLDTVGATYTSGSMNLIYDNTVLSLESAETGRMLSGCMSAVNPNYRENAVRLNFLGQQGISGSGEICRLTFTALKDGEARISVENELFYTDREQEHTANKGTGTVTAGAYSLSVNGPSTAEAWKEFTAFVAFSAAPGVAGGSFVVSYDAENFGFLGYSEVLTGYAVTVNESYAPGQIKVSFAGTEGLPEGKLLSLRFISKENPDGGLSTEFGFADGSVTLYTQSGAKIVPAVSGLSLTLEHTEETYDDGDADVNGTVDTRDATALLKYISGNSGALPVDDFADLNGDGEITDADMDYLMKLLAGWDPSEIN